MSLFDLDIRGEMNQLKTAAGEIVEEKISPMVRESISQAGEELSNVVAQASNELQNNIRVLSDEIHDQRRLTKEDIMILIDYAADRFGKTVDERIVVAKQEVSSLIVEKIAHVRAELEDAAIRSRKTLWANIALSVLAAVAMAIVGIIYRKINLGELDVFWLFRVLLLSAATGTGLFALLKTITQWRTLNKAKKGAITIAINYLGAIRPNGAAGLFFATLLLAASWFILAFYVH